MYLYPFYCMNEEAINKIKEIAEPIVVQRDMFLVDVEVKHQKTPEIWLYVDSEAKDVNLDECSEISKEVGRLLDLEELFGGSYRLNVSSPGLSRPLKDRRQYPKNVGRQVKVKYRQEGEYRTVKGKLKQVDSDRVKLLQTDEKDVDILFDDIVESKVIPKI